MKNKFLYFLLFFTFQSFAQDFLNIPVSGNNNQVRAVNLRENGIIVFDKSPQESLMIHKVDTSLQIDWTTQIEISNRLEYVDNYYDGSFLHLILTSKNNRNLTVVKISTSFPGYQIYEVPMASNFQYSFFTANDKGIVLGGSLKNEPFLVILETVDPTPKFISTGLKGDLGIESLEIEDERIYVTFINTFKRKNQLILREYNLEGKVISSQNIPAAENTVFLSGHYFKTSEKSFVIGNFGGGYLTGREVQNSQGIYVLNNENGDIKYYSFSAFENLFNFLNERQQDRIRRRADRKKSRGDEYNFDYRLLITDLQAQGGQTLIIGEVFRPEYRNRNYPGFYDYNSYSSMYWGRPSLYRYYWLNNPVYGYNYRSSQVFDGFRYFEGVVFSISDEGEFLWDISFPYKYLKYVDLGPHLYLNQENERSKVIFNNGSLLQVSEFDYFGNQTADRELDPKALLQQFDIKKSEFVNFDHWYQNVYLNWGVQKAASNNNFFIQKIIP